MTTNDNWGWRARIGLFIVGNEAVPEAEWWAMAPPGVSVHAARVTARAPWARWREDRKGVEPEEDLLRGCRQFAAMRLSAVLPYQVVTLSLEIERQKLSWRLASLVQRSMRAKSPSRRGR